MQDKVDSLHVGVSSLDDIKALFGEPEELVKGVQWTDSLTAQKRTMHHAGYPSTGPAFSLFSDPRRLYSTAGPEKMTSPCRTRDGIAKGNSPAGSRRHHGGQQ